MYHENPCLVEGGQRCMQMVMNKPSNQISMRMVRSQTGKFLLGMMECASVWGANEFNHMRIGGKAEYSIYAANIMRGEQHFLLVLWSWLKTAEIWPSFCLSRRLHWELVLEPFKYFHISELSYLIISQSPR